MRFILDALGLGGGGGVAKEYLRELDKGAYKSPSGAVVKFDFEDVESTPAESKAAAFETAVGNGTYVQPNGHTSGRFPMVCFFHGTGYEQRAQAFVSAVLDGGVGQLTHPSYSVPINVVHVGEIRFSEPLKSAAGQAVIFVEFWETTGLQIGQAGSLPQLFDALVDAASVDFSDKVQLDDIGSQKSFINKVTSVVKKVSAAMTGATKAVSNATGGIEDVGNSINRGIDMAVGQPLALARQVQILIGEPRRQLDNIKSKWESYKDLAADIFGGDTAGLSTFSNDSINGFHMDKLVGASIVANGGRMLAEGDHKTKADYIRSAEELKVLLEDYQAWSDTNYAALAATGISPPSIDTGGGRLELQALTAFSLSELITKSFSAKTEMRAPLESDRTPIDLCFELYGTAVQDYLDLFAYSNELVGEEHFLIPKGREIVWYV
jgi:prophage DNA circulation protein